MLKTVSKMIFSGLCATFALAPQMQAQECYAPSSCDPCNTCCDNFWVDAEYLYWKIKRSPEPVPLVTTGPIPTTGSGGVLGQPGTEVVLGGNSMGTDWRSGGKFTLGYWFDDCHCLGAELNYLFLAKESRRQTVSSSGLTGSELLAIPFYDVTIPGESSTGLALLDVFSGVATRKIVNNMQGAELNVLANFPCDCEYNVELLGGFRYWNFDETFTFDTSSPYIETPDVWITKDKFHVENNFYGPQVGLGLDYVCDQFSFKVKGKVAIGAMCEEVDIDGELLTNDYDGFTTVQTFEGGYFALPTNIGHHKHTQFSVIPEACVNIGYQVTDCFSIQLGYTFLYVSNVLRAGKQIDRDINPTQSVAYENTPDVTLVGEEAPKAYHKSSDFWAQGVNVGFEYRF